MQHAKSSFHATCQLGEDDSHQPILQQENHVQQLQNQEKGSQGSNKLQEANHVQQLQN